jgi:hypothetical protein
VRFRRWEFNALRRESIAMTRHSTSLLTRHLEPTNTQFPNARLAAKPQVISLRQNLKCPLVPK